jgi:hypothetical protein
LIKRVSVCAALVVALTVACAGTAYAADGRSLSLSASKFGFAAEPGQQGSGEVFVINEGTAPVAVRVYAADQVIAEDGSATYVVPTINEGALNSPASWVTFELPADAKSTGNIPYVEIPAGGRVPVKFEVTVPEGAAPGDRQAVLFFEMFSPQDTNDKAATSVNARLGARIQTRVKGEVVEKLEVRPFTMPQFVVGSNPAYAFAIRNEGNVDERVDARLVVLDRSDNEKQASQILTDTPVYASTSRVEDGMLQLQGLALGPTRVRLVVSYKGDSGVMKSIEKDRTVWAIPLWLLIALGALLVALVLWGVWAASSRSARRKMARSQATPTAGMDSDYDASRDELPEAEGD